MRAVLAAGLGASLPRASESEVVSGRRPSASEAGTSSSPRQRVCDPTENTLSALFEFPKKRGPAQSSRIPGSQNGSRNFAQSAPRPRAVNSLPRGLATSGPRGAGQEPTGSSRPRLQRVPTHEGLALRWCDGDVHSVETELPISNFVLSSGDRCPTRCSLVERAGRGHRRGSPSFGATEASGRCSRHVHGQRFLGVEFRAPLGRPGPCQVLA